MVSEKGLRTVVGGRRHPARVNRPLGFCSYRRHTSFRMKSGTQDGRSFCGMQHCPFRARKLNSPKGKMLEQCQRLRLPDIEERFYRRIILQGCLFSSLFSTPDRKKEQTPVEQKSTISIRHAWLFVKFSINAQIAQLTVYQEFCLHHQENKKTLIN